MRLILASVPLVLALACTSSGDSVDNDDPSITDDGADAGDDEDESGDDTSSEPDADTNDDDSDAPDGEPEPDVPDIDVPIPDDDDDSEPSEPEPVSGAGGSDEMPEPEVSSGGASSSGGSTSMGGGSTAGGASNGGAGSGQGGTEPGECPRPIEDYTLFGEECNAADFDCEDYFQDECGCGCGDTQCRPDDAYLATGDECSVAAVSCPAGQTYFEDDCGCGCEGTNEPVCSEPADYYLMDDPAACLAAFFVCEDEQEPFFDECGCGCRPGPQDGCPSPNGNRVGIPPDQIATYTCWETPGESRVIEDADELEEFLAGCESAPQSITDFSAYTVYAAVVPERTNVELAYVVEDINGSFHVGIQAEAYCGGARPPNTVLIVAISKAEASVFEQRCADLGMCDPDILPP